MNVLVVGSGGREHALCWALSASPMLDRLYCAPGNAGIAEVAGCIALDPMDFEGITTFCKAERISLVVIGPEAPLVNGLVDRLEEAGVPAFGPHAHAAVLEGSKKFTKDLCVRAGIPTAAYGAFSRFDEARRFIEGRGAPIVVKADGLAAGKGVVVARTVEEAVNAAAEVLGGRFGPAGNKVVIEEFLDGEEASFFALVDGRTALPLASAQDHKAVYDGDEGPNTGGMGAYSPAPAVTPMLAETVMATIIRPTVAAMAAENRPFKGVLYAGLMLTSQGPKLLEYNVRFGDPECQVLMMRLQSDLLPALLAARDGVLDHFDLRWKPEAALCVVMAAKGYPGAYEKGSVIANLDAAGEMPGVTVFHAGTRKIGDRIVADGGRVLGVTAVGHGVGAAQERAYRAVRAIDWPSGFYRRDIGWRAVAAEAR